MRSGMLLRSRRMFSASNPLMSKVDIWRTVAHLNERSEWVEQFEAIVMNAPAAVEPIQDTEITVAEGVRSDTRRRVYLEKHGENQIGFPVDSGGRLGESGSTPAETIAPTTGDFIRYPADTGDFYRVDNVEDWGSYVAATCIRRETSHGSLC